MRREILMELERLEELERVGMIEDEAKWGWGGYLKRRGRNGVKENGRNDKRGMAINRSRKGTGRTRF